MLGSCARSSRASIAVAALTIASCLMSPSVAMAPTITFLVCEDVKFELESCVRVATASEIFASFSLCFSVFVFVNCIRPGSDHFLMTVAVLPPPGRPIGRALANSNTQRVCVRYTRYPLLPKTSTVVLLSQSYPRPSCVTIVTTCFIPFLFGRSESGPNCRKNVAQRYKESDTCPRRFHGLLKLSPMPIHLLRSGHDELGGSWAPNSRVQF